jgi:hypothetical protein
MEPLVIEYLRTHTLEQLEEEHGVCARPNAGFDKFSLNYDQILVKSSDALASQCRGMVIRPSEQKLDDTNWRKTYITKAELLAWPMDRFFNWGDVACAPVVWSDPELKALEKLDGTCCIVYWDDFHGKWHVGTRSVSEADLPVRKDDMVIGNMTFAGLFWMSARATVEDRHMDGWSLEDHLVKGHTYVFELTGPHNRIVVKYDEPRITLLAVRDNKTGLELDAFNMKGLGPIPRPRTWPISDPAALATFVNSQDPAQLEGAVAIDSQHNRVKVKSMAWVLSSRAKDLVTVSRRGALEAIITGTIDDVIPLVSADIAHELEYMREGLRTYLRSIDASFVDWKSRSAGSRKEFAALVMASGDWSPAYFALWEGRVTSAHDFVVMAVQKGKLSPSTLDTLLGKIDIRK